MMWQLIDKITPYFSHSEETFVDLANAGYLAYFLQTGTFNVLSLDSGSLEFQMLSNEPCFFVFIDGKIYFREEKALGCLDLSDFNYETLPLQSPESTWIVSENLFSRQTVLARGSNAANLGGELFHLDPFSSVYQWKDEFNVWTSNAEGVVVLSKENKDQIRLVHSSNSNQLIDISLERPVFGNGPSYFDSEKIALYLGPVRGQGGFVQEPGKLVCYSIESGDLLWEVPKVSPNFEVDTNGKIYSLSRKFLFEVAVENGGMLRSNIGKELSGLGLSPSGKPAFEDGLLHFSSSSSLAAIDLESQSVVWHTDLEKEMLRLGYKSRLGNPHIASGKLFAKDQEGTLWIFEKIVE